MPRRFAAAILAAAVAGAMPAAAQVHGLPVFRGALPAGLELGGEVGFADGGTAFGGTVAYGRSRFGVSGTVAGFDGDGGQAGSTSLGATAGWRVFGGPLVPFALSLQAGAAWRSVDQGGEDVAEWRLPVGLGIGVTIPSPAVAFKPWLAPRLHVRVLDGDAETGAGLAAGLDLAFLSGFSVGVAYDFAGNDTSPSTLGLNVRYGFGR